MTEMLRFAIETIEAAGRLTLAHFQNGVRVELKPDASPVTVADEEAEAFIRERIRRHYPGHAILGEEGGAEGDAEERWVIDPIDGTKSFVCGVPLYGCLLSYEVGGLPQVAAISFPALGDLVWAEAGQGAFLNGRSIRVSDHASLDGAVICVAGHKNMARLGYAGPFERNVAPRAMATRTWSDAYGHFLVASGRVAAMIDPVLEPYDVSAPWLIVQEAGGRVTSLRGEPGLHREALSSNGRIHDALVAALR